MGFGNNGLAKANLHGANDQKVLAGGDRESVGAGFTDSGTNKKVKDKVYELAKEISVKGVSPLDVPALIPHPIEKNKFIVVEGNRRFAALKILKKPSLCKDARARAAYERLARATQIELPRSLECTVFDTLADAEYWIKARHGGENRGAGTVNWGPKEYSSFENRMGRKTDNTTALKLINYAFEQGLISEDQYQSVHITNVTRLLGTKSVRPLLGLDVSRGEINRVCNKEYFDTAISDVLTALASGDWTVTKLKSAEQRENFVKGIKDENSWGSYSVDSPTEIKHIDFDSTDNESTGSENEPIESEGPESSSNGRGGAKSSLARKKLLPPGLNVKIKHQRLKDIFVELKRLDATFTNSGAVLTRVFLEGLTDEYLNSQGFEVGFNDKLAKKAQKVRNDILVKNNNSRSVKNDLKGYEVLHGDHSHIGSSDSFNAFVHNMSFNISPDELKNIWNNLSYSLKWFEGHV